MKNKKVLDFIKRYVIITIGCVIYSLGVELFLGPNNIATGGVTGIALLIEHLAPLGAGVWVLILNVPMFILGAISFGKQFLASSLYSTALSSVLMEIFGVLLKNYVPITQNTMIAAISGGLLFGVGVALIFRMGSSTGGTDVLVKVLRKKFRHIRTGELAIAIDIVIVLTSSIVYNDFETGFYSAISLIVFMVAFDFVLYGGNSAKMIYIVPSIEDSSQICNCIMKELDTGATYISGKGAYTGNDKDIIMCVCKSSLYPKLRDIVHREDAKAFIIVSSAREIYGEGYKDPNAEEL